MTDTNPALRQLAVLLQLGRRARESASLEALGFVMVNETRQLFDYRQAALAQPRFHGMPFESGVSAVSGLPQPDPQAPYVQWMGRLLAQLAKQFEAETPVAFGAADLPEILAREWSAWLPEHALLLPLGKPGGRRLSSLVLARDVSMPQVSTHNTILMGSRRANPWVGLFEEKLNFRTIFEESPKVVYFQNVAPKAGEQAEYRGQWSKLSYCRVAYLPNPKGSGSVLLISGTDVQATEAGGEFVTNEHWVQTFRNALGLKPDELVPHFEFLLEGKMVINTVPQFQVIAWRRH